MIYIYRCRNMECDIDLFEVEQKMMDTHEADCPRCGEESNRVYSVLPFQFGRADYNKDGSRDLNPDLPHVPSGTKFTHGWTKEKESGGN